MRPRSNLRLWASLALAFFLLVPGARATDLTIGGDLVVGGALTVGGAPVLPAIGALVAGDCLAINGAANGMVDAGTKCGGASFSAAGSASSGLATPQATGATYGGDVQIAADGAGGPLQSCRVTTTIGSPVLTVSGSGCAPFTIGDVGKLAAIANAGISATASWTGTISSYNSATSVSLNTTAGQALAAAAEPFRWGHDEGTAINSCIAAAQSAGEACFLPPPVKQAWGSTVAIALRPGNAPAALLGAGRNISRIAALSSMSALASTGSTGALRGSTLDGIGFDGGKLVADVGYFSCLTSGSWHDVAFYNAMTVDLVFGDSAGAGNGCGGNHVDDVEAWNLPLYYAGDFPAAGMTVALADNRFTRFILHEDASYGIHDTSSGENQFEAHIFAPTAGGAEIGLYIDGAAKDIARGIVCDAGVLKCVLVGGSKSLVLGGVKQGSSPSGSTGVEVATGTTFNVVIGFDNVANPSADVVWDTPVDTNSCSTANAGTVANSPGACQ